MLYNKKQFTPINDKKVLHKIKRHWVTVSIAMLGLIGGGATATTNVSANTNDANVSNQNDNQVNHSLNVSRLRNSQSKLVNNDQNNYNNKITPQPVNNVNIKAKINQLHKNIINNAVVNSIRKSNISQVKNDSHTTQMLPSSARAASASTSLSQTTSTSVNGTNSTAESTFASNAMASVLSHGGHMISVSPAVRSFMINGASEIASYNQTTESNANATFNYLNSLSSNTSSLASEKSLAESYARSFYTNQQNKNNMIMNDEAAHDIEVWGEDPNYFTLYQANPERIINNVRSFYEPNASIFASLAGSVKNNIKSLYDAQMTSHSSSTAASSDSKSQDFNSLSSLLSSDASTLNSYNQENNSYLNTILMDLDTLDVSSSPILSYAKNNVSKYSNRITSFMNKESNEANSLNNYSNYSNSAANASTVSTANKDISQASLASHDASLVMENYINPLEEQLKEQSSANINSSQFNFNSMSANESLSNSIQNSIVVSQYNSSVDASNLARASLMTSASISNSVANSIANDNAQANNPKETSHSNSQFHLNLNERSTSNSNIIQNKSNGYQSSNNGANSVNFRGNSSSRNMRSNVNMSDAPQNKHVIKDNQQTDNQLNSDTDDTGNLNNNGSGANNQNQIASTDNDQLSNQSINNSQRTAERINTVNGNRRNEGTGTTHVSDPMINNNSTTDAADVGSNQDNSTNVKLPQTGDTSFKDEEMAEIALIMSITFGALATYIDKRRDN